MNKIRNYLKAIKQGICSFWKYNNHEDKIARNLWVGFMISLMLLTPLAFLLDGQI